MIAGLSTAGDLVVLGVLPVPIDLVIMLGSLACMVALTGLLLQAKRAERHRREQRRRRQIRLWRGRV